MDALCSELENMPFHVFNMKEEDAAVMLMSTYGENERVGGEKFRMLGGAYISFN